MVAFFNWINACGLLYCILVQFRKRATFPTCKNGLAPAQTGLFWLVDLGKAVTAHESNEKQRKDLLLIQK
jgi:hypothetical protein